MWLSSLYRGRELTEIEAAAKLAYAANGGLTMRGARDLIRNPWKWDMENHGERFVTLDEVMGA